MTGLKYVVAITLTVVIVFGQGVPGAPQAAPPNGAPSYTATDFGAAGNCTTDDTAALQAGITAVLNQVSASPKIPGKLVLIAGRCYKISSTLVFNSVRDGLFDGNGAVIQWAGNNTTPAILLSDVRDTALENFRIGAGASFPLATGIRVENGADSIIAPSSNRLANIVIETDANGLGTGVHIAQGVGGNFNNENHSLFKVRVRQYNDAAFKIDGSQSKNIQFVDCECTSYSQAASSACVKSGLVSGGSFHWRGGSGNGNSLADFQIVNSSDTISVTGYHSEGAKRLVLTGGPSNAPLPLKLEGVRYSADSLASDRIAIEYRFPGPLVVENSIFGEANQPLPRVRITASGPASVTFIGNLFGSYNSQSEDPLILAGSNIEAVWMNNSFVDGSGSMAKRDGVRMLGTMDASTALGSRPFRTGGSLPLLCTQGELFFMTAAIAGNNLYACASNNQWTQIGAAATTTPPNTPPPPTDTTPPTVSITNVSQGAQLTGIVSVQATANDNTGVTKVEFYVDSSLAGTSTIGPYIFNWNTSLFTTGGHTLQAKAYDAMGNVGLSTLLTVTIGSPSGGGTAYITNVVGASPRNDYGGWVGMRIVVGSSPITVTALGRWVLAGNAEVHALKLVDASTGLDLAGGVTQVNLNGAAPGSFQYAPLPSPVTLPANSTWYVVSSEAVFGDLWYDANTVVTTTSAATLASAVYWGGASWRTTGIMNRMYVPVGFKYQ